LLHNEHGFKQAPLEEIDEGTYLEMRKTVTPITSIAQLEIDEVEIDDCEGGACPSSMKRLDQCWVSQLYYLNGKGLRPLSSFKTGRGSSL
jgi:hypothetical protein